MYGECTEDGGAEMLGKITGKTAFLEKALDASWMKNTAILNNMANVDTPGYKRQDVRFEDILTEMTDLPMAETGDGNPKFMPVSSSALMNSIQPSIVTDDNTRTRKDGNNVDADVEMTEMAKNTIKYNGLIQILSKEYSKLKTAITGGR